VRAQVDDRSESIGRKIRDAELEKLPYMLVVGDREESESLVGVREHRGGDTGVEPVDAFVARISELIRSRALSH
jgi:threonyl-tRNA synthetase